MPTDENYDFNLEKQRAAQRLRELGARSKYKQQATLSRHDKTEDDSASCRPQKNNSPLGFLSEIGLPFFNNSDIDSDIALIIGLVLILSAENSDKLLLLALLYILI